MSFRLDEARKAVREALELYHKQGLLVERTTSLISQAALLLATHEPDFTSPITPESMLRWKLLWDKLDPVIASASQGDQSADSFLRDVARNSDGPIPKELGRYLADHGPPRRPRGQLSSAREDRNWSIAKAVGFAVTCGLNPTRNEITTHESACSLVSSELARLGYQLDEKTIEGISKTYR